MPKFGKKLLRSSNKNKFVSLKYQKARAENCSELFCFEL